MKKIILLIVLLIQVNDIMCQIKENDKTHKSIVNENYTGNVSETGVNAGKVINRKLEEVDKKVNAIEEPEGWNELLREAEIKQEKERKEQQKNDSIRKDLDNKANVVLIEKQKVENFRNKMIGYLIGAIALFFLIIILKKLISVIRGKMIFSHIKVNFSENKQFDVSEINKNEVLLISISIGLIISILSGSVFSKNTYYKLYKGNKIEVSKEISTFQLSEFNYLLAVVAFIFITGIIYLFLKNKIKTSYTEI